MQGGLLPGYIKEVLIGSIYQQTKDDYFYCYNSPVNDNPNDYENIYVWLYRNWDDTNFININDKNNKQIIENSIDVISSGFKQEYNFDKARTGYIGDWTFGKKIRTRRVFKNNNKLIKIRVIKDPIEDEQKYISVMKNNLYKKYQ